MILLDAGVWIAAKNSTETFFEGSRRLVFDEAVAVAALDLTYYEVANVVGAREKLVEAAREICEAIDTRCGRDGVVRIDSRLAAEAAEIAAEHGITAYDAAYVATARRNEWTLVSTDVADLVSKGLAVTPDAALYP
jgi:predicted nucleic acid-binding protein